VSQAVFGPSGSHLLIGREFAPLGRIAIPIAGWKGQDTGLKDVIRQAPGALRPRHRTRLAAAVDGRRTLSFITRDPRARGLDGPAAHVNRLESLHHNRVVFRQRLELLARAHLNDLVAAGLEIIENLPD